MCLRESLQGSSRVWIRAWMNSSVYSSVSTRRTRVQCQSSGKPVESRQSRLREDARARRRTERGVRRDRCAIVSFKTVRRREVHISSRVMCDICGRSVFSFQGCLFSDSGQSQFKREQFIRIGYFMMTGTELWEVSRVEQVWTIEKGLWCAQETHCRERKQAQRKDDDMLSESRFDFVSELTTRGTAPPLSPISEHFD